MAGYIYLISDSGYDDASKIGFSSNIRNVWKCVPSFSPRPMRFDAAWEIPERLMQGEGSAIAQRRRIEQKLHSLCGDLVHLQPGKHRAGIDWVLVSPGEAERIITKFMGSEPCLRDGHRGQVVINDNFRNPHPSKVIGHRFKVAVWVYREMGTGHLKTQVYDDWANPNETKRRYSVNGFEELAAFTYDGNTNPGGNKTVQDAWTMAVETFGYGPEDKYYGWLRPDTPLNELLSFYTANGLFKCQQIGKGSPVPLGIRKTYNRPE